MRRRRDAARVAVLGLVLAATGPAVAFALSPEEVKHRWRERLAGKHFVSSVTLHYRFGHNNEKRSVTVWRDDPEEGERLMARFESPAHLRGFGLLYLEQPGRANDYFIYQPEAHRVRRISEGTARQDIYGVDLEFLGFGIAQDQPTEVESLDLERLDGREVYRLEERAVAGEQRFERRVAYLDPKMFLPLRVEHYRDGALVLVATTEETALVQGVPTPTRVRFVRPREANEVLMAVESVDYEKPIPGAFFSTLALVKQ
jgi:hypothetical protein